MNHENTFKPIRLPPRRRVVARQRRADGHRHAGRVLRSRRLHGSCRVGPTARARALRVARAGPTTTPLPSRTASPTPTPSPTPLVICSPNPDPASPAALQVETPEAEEKTTIPVRVRGWSTNIGEEGKVVFVAIVDQNQKVLQMNEVPPQPREFRVPPPGLGITEFTRPFAIDILLDDVDQETPDCI